MRMRKKRNLSGKRRKRENRMRIIAGILSFLLLAGVVVFATRCTGTDGEKEAEEYEPGEREYSDTSGESYGVFLGVDRESFSVDLFEDYELVVVDAQELRPEQLAQLHATGHTVYSYLNVGSIEKSRSYFDEYRDCCLDRYENWPDEYWVDVSKDKWKQFATGGLLDRIRVQDPRIDGLFLDNLDIYSHMQEKKKYSSLTGEAYAGLKEILSAYREEGLPVLINGADVFVEELLSEGEEELIRGVNQETVFSRILDYDRDRFGENKEKERAYYQQYLAKCRKAGLDVYLLEYTTDEELISEILKYCDKNGFRCYISAHVNLNPRDER